MGINYLPKEYLEKYPQIIPCGSIRMINDRYFMSGQATIELLPGEYTYKWESDGYIKYSGTGKFIAKANEVHVLVCTGQKFGAKDKFFVLKMPYKLTETNINIRKER